MGTFGGHFIPGMFSLIIGLRWTYCSFRRFFLCRREQALTDGKSRRYRSSITYPVSCCPGFPTEAAALLISMMTISIIELISGSFYGFHQSAFHISMYSFVGISAIIMMLKHFRFSIVPDAEYACFILSFLVNVFVMQRHAPGKSTLEKQLHQNEMLVMFALAVVMALEMKYRLNPLLPIIRAIGFSLQGSWLIMIGYILFWPWGAWAPEDPKSIMMVTISFVVHIAISLQLASLIGAIALLKVRSLVPAEVSLALDRDGLNHQEETDNTIAFNSERNEYLPVNSDEEDEETKTCFKSTKG